MKDEIPVLLSLPAPRWLACSKKRHTNQEFIFHSHYEIMALYSHDRISTPASNPRPPLEERIRHRHQQRAQRRQERNRPTHFQALIQRNRNLHHPPRGNIPDQRDARERAGAVRLVAVDDVLVAGDEDAEDAVAEEHARC